MPKVILEFEGEKAYIDLGLTALATKAEKTEEETEVQAARRLLGNFIRATILEVQLAQADAVSQSIVDAALAQKDAIMAGISGQTSEALDAVVYTVRTED
jgi:hypothetical protein